MTDKLRAAMQQALEALETVVEIDQFQGGEWETEAYKTITALREALAEQAEQYPSIDFDKLHEMNMQYVHCPACGSDMAKAYSPKQTEQTNEALIDELVICGIYQREHDSDPRKALLDVIHWHVAVALDPAVSAEARALQNTSRAEQPASQEPVAIVTGYYGGRLTVTPFNLASTLPTGMALYAAPQPVIEPVACERCEELAADKGTWYRMADMFAHRNEELKSVLGKALNLIEGEWPEGDEIVQPVIDEIREALEQPVSQEPLMITPGGGAFPFVEVGYIGEFVAPTESLPAGTPLYVAPVEQAEKEPLMNYERINALREGEQNGAEDAYFFVRPENDTPSLRKMFCQGFERGFHKGLKYAAPVRTKDLSDEEIDEIPFNRVSDDPLLEYASAVIAKYKEKNK